MTTPPEDILTRGMQGSFHWLASTDHYMGAFLNLCPEVIRDRYIAVVLIDGGTLHLSESERQDGWEVREKVGYSPLLRGTEQLRYQLDGPDGPGYDE